MNPITHGLIGWSTAHLVSGLSRRIWPSSSPRPWRRISMGWGSSPSSPPVAPRGHCSGGPSTITPSGTTCHSQSPCQERPGSSRAGPRSRCWSFSTSTSISWATWSVPAVPTVRSGPSCTSAPFFGEPAAHGLLAVGSDCLAQPPDQLAAPGSSVLAGLGSRGVAARARRRRRRALPTRGLRGARSGDRPVPGG